MLDTACCLLRYHFPPMTVCSFDITSNVDLQEVDNALNQARKEVAQRYDFKGTKTSIELKEKKLEKSLSIAKDIRSKISDAGDASVAKSIWAAAKVDTTAEFTSVGNIPGIGRDFAFSDYSLGAELNKWSQPVKGSLGSYLIKVNYKVKFDQGTFEVEKPTIKKQMLQTKKSSYFGQWVQDLKKEAKIVDNRYHFYR